MKARFVLAGALALAGSSLAGASRADVPPSPVDELCDLEHASAVAGSCQACEADFKDARRCERVLGTLGLHRHCRGFGSLQWTEVWCRARPAQASPREAPAAPSAPATARAAPEAPSPASPAPHEAPESPSASATASDGGAESQGPRAETARGAGRAVDPIFWALPAGGVGALALFAALRRYRRLTASRSRIGSPPPSSGPSERPPSDSEGT
jgi:hypothetical protein